MGLACAETTGVLFALTAGEGARPAELYTIDRNTGVESLVGPTGTGSGALQSLEHIRIDTTTDKLVAAGTQLYNIDMQTGLASAVGGKYGMLWGLAMNTLDLPVNVPAASVHAATMATVLMLGFGLRAIRSGSPPSRSRSRPFRS